MLSDCWRKRSTQTVHTGSNGGKKKYCSDFCCTIWSRVVWCGFEHARDQDGECGVTRKCSGSPPACSNGQKQWGMPAEYDEVFLHALVGRGGTPSSSQFIGCERQRLYGKRSRVSSTYFNFGYDVQSKCALGRLHPPTQPSGETSKRWKCDLLLLLRLLHATAAL